MTFDTVSGQVSIPAGTSVSSHLAMYNIHHISLWLPTAWTAASLVLQLSRLTAPATAPAVDAEWFTVADSIGEVVFAASAGLVLVMPTSILLPPAFWLRVVSGTTAARVNQASTRNIDIVGRRY